MDATTHRRKAAMRTAHLAGRRALRSDPDRKRALDDGIAAATLACIDTFGARGTNIAAYSPLPSEPAPADLPARLADVARAVFLPISLPDGVLALSLIHI